MMEAIITFLTSYDELHCIHDSEDAGRDQQADGDTDVVRLDAHVHLTHK